MEKVKIIFLCAVFLTAAPFIADAAVLYILPQAQTVYLGDTFIVEVRLDTEGKEINAAEANLTFSINLIDVLDVSTGGSALSIPVKGRGDSKGGDLFLAGGAPEGFTGDGLVGRITFSTKAEGTAVISFADDSRVLLNDGSGTPAELIYLEGIYLIGKRPEGWVAISAPTHPNQSKWEQGSTLRLHWDPAQDAEYSYILSRDPLAEPDEIPDKPAGELLWIGDMEYAWLEDGIYYFHLRQAVKDAPGQITWGPKITFRAMIDATPPEDFQPKFVAIEGRQYIAFNAFDKTSGIDHYEVQEQPLDFWGNPKEVAGEWQKGQSPYLPSDQKLNSIIRVRAFDGAGNTRVAELAPPKKPLWKTALPWIILAVLFALMAWIGKKKFNKKSGKKI